MTTLRLALAQFNPVLGDVAGNARRIKTLIKAARDQGADLAAFPEMAVTGYPPEDLLLKADFIEAAATASDEIVKDATGLTAVFGAPHMDRDLYNAAFIAHDGRLAGVQHKRRLPNYGVFDENRYFESDRKNHVFNRRGFLFGVSVCEDIWGPGGPPAEQAVNGRATLLVNISASPHHMGKGADRERMLSTRAADCAAFVAYCNMVGGQDELVFDGHSLVFDPRGSLLARGAQFEEDLLLVDLDAGDLVRARMFDPRRRQWRASPDAHIETRDLAEIAQGPKPSPASPRMRPPLAETAEVRAALVLGLGDYVRKSGFEKVVVGLSGGVDSALTAVLAAEALGPENVLCVAMPSRYSSDHSLSDAEALAENLGADFMKLGIERVFSAFLDTLAPAFSGRPEDVTEENIQPRIRGVLLMALSNKLGRLVLTTGNKSEAGVGYSTLYGDTAGGLAVIKDVPKTLVYALCEHINETADRPLIPENILTKPPSAELRPDQVDSDSLPPYETLDPILAAYVEEGLDAASIAARGFDEKMVETAIAMVDRNEYKRRQSPPGLKITSRAFGKDWRLPIVNRYGKK